METIKTTKYLVFIKEDRPKDKKTDSIIVSNIHHNQTIGYIKWYSNWRQYCFFPYGDTIWNTDCLEEINGVIRGLMDDRKQQTLANKKIVGVIALNAKDFNDWLLLTYSGEDIKYVCIRKPGDCDGYKFNKIFETDMAVYNPNRNTILKHDNIRSILKY